MLMVTGVMMVVMLGVMSVSSSIRRLMMAVGCVVGAVVMLLTLMLSVADALRMQKVRLVVMRMVTVGSDVQRILLLLFDSRRIRLLAVKVTVVVTVAVVVAHIAAVVVAVVRLVVLLMVDRFRHTTDCIHLLRRVGRLLPGSIRAAYLLLFQFSSIRPSAA